MSTQVISDAEQRQQLVEGMYANRKLVLTGCGVGVAAGVTWAVLSLWTDALGDLRLITYAAVSIMFCLLGLFFLGPPNRFSYPALLSSCVLTCGAMLVILWDAIEGNSAPLNLHGTVPIEVTVLPMVILFSYAYLLPKTAFRINLGFIILSIGVGLLAYADGPRQSLTQVPYAVWTVNTYVMISALTMVFANLHIRHARLIGGNLDQRREQLLSEINELKYALNWDADVGCLSPRGVEVALDAHFKTQGEDLLIAVVQRRDHPSQGSSQPPPTNWREELKQAVNLLRESHPDLDIGCRSETSLVIWCTGMDAAGLTHDIETLSWPNSQQAFYASARAYFVGQSDGLLSIGAILDELETDLFLHVHCQD